MEILSIWAPFRSLRSFFHINNSRECTCVYSMYDYPCVYFLGGSMFHKYGSMSMVGLAGQQNDLISLSR